MKNEMHQMPALSSMGANTEILESQVDAMMSPLIAGKAGKVAEKKIDEIKSLEERMRDATSALDLACSSFKEKTGIWLEEEFPKTLKEVRLTRMAMTSEFSVLMKQISDLRAFFIGPDYEKEIARLRDFVTLCERLRELKESGFLDTVADTMLRLSDK